jgi:hypothetical protein
MSLQQQHQQQGKQVQQQKLCHCYQRLCLQSAAVALLLVQSAVLI